MKTKLLLFLVVVSVAAIAQGRGGGKPSPGAGRAEPPGRSAPPAAERSQGQQRGQQGGGTQRGEQERPAQAGGAKRGEQDGGEPAAQQRPKPKRTLDDSQLDSGAGRMLQRKTGMSAAELRELYNNSGARNFGQFVSAVVVSRNLNLDHNSVLRGLEHKSLGEVLQEHGVEPQRAREEIRAAEREARQANREQR